MMHTVEEARKLWCPMARVAAHFQQDFRNNVSFNRDPDGLTKQAYCIASDCMMWRWVTTLDGDKGYCGLAGVPK